MAIAAATGTPAFGLERFKPSRQFRVLYCSQEDTNAIVKPRARKMLAARGITEIPDNLGFSVHKGINLDDSRWEEHFYAEVLGNAIELVFLDPIRYFTEHADKGPADVMPVTKYLRRFAEVRITPHLSHHDVKPPATGSDSRRKNQRASGGGWFSSSECPMTFEKISPIEALVSPEDYKISGDPAPFKIRYVEDENGIRLIAETTRSCDAKALALDEKVLTYISENQGKSGSRIAEAIRVRKDDALESLHRLGTAGKIDSVKKGRAELWMLSHS